MAEKILVVDDETDICRILTKILELAGYEVKAANSGVEALRLAKEFMPALVFLDYMMPDITGLEVLRGIKAYSDEIYVVMVTGRGSEEVAASVMKAGASDYVIKPFAKDQILKVTRDTLRIREAEISNKRLKGELQELNRDLEDKVHQRTSELVEAQERLVQQQNMASLGEMSGGMAHEIRNPLNSISLYAEILRDELEEKDPKNEYIGKILSDVDRINDIVTNLQSFSRRLKGDKSPTDVKEVMEASIRMLSTQFAQKGINVSMDADGTLPETLASREEIEEVFSHLLINAMQAMPSGGDISVRMRLLTGAQKGIEEEERPHSEYIEVIVQDTGIGISKENIDRIFIPFFTTKTDWKGTGLGLSVVHRIITDHHGAIDVESDAGKGSKFIIRLPVLDAGSAFEKLPKAV
jgi:signal transduction histidine kinase